MSTDALAESREAASEGHYTVNRDGDRVWVGSAASELAYHAARADTLTADNLELRQEVAKLRAALIEACRVHNQTITGAFVK